MQFQIPQFIEVEDRIFGPLTFKQFIYIAGGLGASYLLFRVLPLLLALPLIGVCLALASALAFMQYNGRPFILALEHGFYFVLHPRLYLWNNERKQHKAVAKAGPGPAGGEVYIPKLSDSKLHELAWSLDIKERIAGGTAVPEERAGSTETLAPVLTMRGALSRG